MLGNVWLGAGQTEVKEFAPSELFYFDDLSPEIQVGHIEYGEFCSYCDEYRIEKGEDVSYSELIDHIGDVCENARLLFTKTGTPVFLDNDAYYEYCAYLCEKEKNDGADYLRLQGCV